MLGVSRITGHQISDPEPVGPGWSGARIGPAWVGYVYKYEDSAANGSNFG